MPSTLQTLGKRDSKERDLSSFEMSIGIVEMDAHKRKAEFKEKLALYQEWKKTNKVEGIKY